MREKENVSKEKKAKDSKQKERKNSEQETEQEPRHLLRLTLALVADPWGSDASGVEVAATVYVAFYPA